MEFSKRNFLSKLLIMPLWLLSVLKIISRDDILGIIDGINQKNEEENIYEYEKRLGLFAQYMIQLVFIVLMLFIYLPYIFLSLLIRVPPSPAFLFMVGIPLMTMMLNYWFKHFNTLLFEMKKKEITPGAFRTSTNNWDLLFFVVPFLAILIGYIV